MARGATPRGRAGGEGHFIEQQRGRISSVEMIEEEQAQEQALHAQAVKSRALMGIKALVVRTLFAQALRVGSSLILAHLLYPKDYGIFGVVAYITGLGMYLGDVGLNASLVRQHRE